MTVNTEIMNGQFAKNKGQQNDIPNGNIYITYLLPRHWDHSGREYRKIERARTNGSLQEDSVFWK